MVRHDLVLQRRHLAALDLLDDLVERRLRLVPLGEVQCSSGPPSTSFCTSHEAGATFVYHGHFVRLLWQSAHESVTIWFTVALWNTAACVTGGFV